MQSASEDLSVNPMNERYKIYFARTLASIGMIFPIAGNFLPPSFERNLCFVMGSVLMLIGAMIEREEFFSVLQLIVLVGAAMAFTPWTLIVRASIPIVTTAVILLWFYVSGRMEDRLTLFGSFGIAVLALGYAVMNPVIYFMGGVILTVYASMAFYRGVKIAIIWAILNFFFAIAAAINIYRFVL